MTMALSGPVQAYPYQALEESDSIRLLLLQPVSIESTLCCSLVHTTLSNCDYDVIDNYTALSYVWGGASNSKVILVDSTPISVTSNLYNALIDLRDQTRVIRLWVDALCINQKDDKEKALQVGMMSEIYASAQHTIIYLGALRPELLSSISINDPMPPPVLNEILSKKWFKRVWVFQELVLSKDPWIQCRNHRWRWDYIYEHLKKVQSQDSWYHDGYHEHSSTESHSPPTITAESSGHDIMFRMDLARQKYQSSRNPFKETLIGLLSARRGLEASDSRDIIYAHIALSSDVTTAFKTDYTKECARVYEEFTVAEIERCQDYSILLHVGDPSSPRRIPNLASWAPDWSHYREPRAVEYEHTYPFRKPPYVRSGCFSVAISELSILACVGHKNETVIRFSKPLSSYELSPDKTAKYVARLQALIRGKPTRAEPTARTLYFDIISLWREAIGDDLVPPENWVDQSFFSLLYQMYTGKPHKILRDLRPLDFLVGSLMPNTGDTFKNGNVLAQLSSGQLLIAPERAREGDFIFYTRIHDTKSHREHNWRHYGTIIREPFLLRPRPEIRTDEDDISIQAKFSERDESGYFTPKETPAPIMHCTFVGTCYIRDFTHQRLEIVYLPRRFWESTEFGSPFIFAIH